MGAQIVHVGGGSMVEPAAVGKTIQIDLKIDAGIIRAVHPASPLENDPHVISVQRRVFCVAGVPPDAADGLIHLWFRLKFRVQFQHGGGKVHDQLAQRLDDQGLVFLFMFCKPAPAVLQPVFKEKIQCFLGKTGVHKCILSMIEKGSPSGLPGSAFIQRFSSGQAVWR